MEKRKLVLFSKSADVSINKNVDSGTPPNVKI